MLCCPSVLVAMETHFYVFTLKYQYFENFFEGIMCDSPVMLPSNRQTSDILTEHTVGML